jgi:hypothetical protein
VRDPYGRILRARARIPAEALASGPWGHRAQVIDYDRTRDLLYPPVRYDFTPGGELIDPFADASDDALLRDPRFHAQNVFAIAMRTLARFEQALGRRVSWGFREAHQLKLVPHAFTDANAFYSRSDEALLFGCFPARDGGGTVFTCLSHDIVAHEVAHALLDGIRTRFMSPSSPDQAAFHEAFADIVAILSVFSLPGVVAAVLPRVPAGSVDEQWLVDSALLGLAEQMGGELDDTRANALRRSASLPPDTRYLSEPEFIPAHRRGEVLVAAVLRALVVVWGARLQGIARGTDGALDAGRVAEEGETIADQLLTMAIRALDYTPPIHIEFGDYLSALLTADAQVRPDDARYRFREHLRETFARYGIAPASDRHLPTLAPTQVALRDELRGHHAPAQDGGGGGARAAARLSLAARVARTDAADAEVVPSEPGLWVPCDHLDLRYDRTHFEPLGREPDEVYRFLWENRVDLRLYEGAFTRVLSVRPCLRVGPDGFVLRETVAEFYQVIRLTPDELRAIAIDVPPTVPRSAVIALYGGGTLIFDEFGRLRFYVHNSLDNPARQSARLAHLWSWGRITSQTGGEQDFAATHRLRALDSDRDPREEW